MVLSPGSDISVWPTATATSSPLLGLLEFGSVWVITSLLLWFSHLRRRSVADQLAALGLPFPGSQTRSGSICGTAVYLHWTTR